MRAREAVCCAALMALVPALQAAQHSATPVFTLTRPLELQDDICWKGFQGEQAQLLFVLPLLHKSPPSLAASLSTQPAFNLFLCVVAVFSLHVHLCMAEGVCLGGA